MMAVFLATAIPFADSSAQRVGVAWFLPSGGGWGRRPLFRQSAELLWRKTDTSTRATAWSVLASAVVPGTGQAWLDQDRFVAYLAVEAYAWARYAADAREGDRRVRNTGISRVRWHGVRTALSAPWAISTITSGWRVRRKRRVRCHPVDLDPEPDSTTANGAIWLLARQTFWTNPSVPPPRDSAEYKFAETFYRERAVGPAYQWSWSNARLEYAEFRRTIRAATTRFELARGSRLVIANHALSTVDAFITVRLRRHVIQTASGSS
jgi:hypothetical protein